MPKTASSSVLVEGVPSDATEREVAHIFRPFQGYITVRIIPADRAEDSDNSRVDGPLCYVDFESNVDDGAALHLIQGKNLNLQTVYLKNFEKIDLTMH